MPLPELLDLVRLTTGYPVVSQRGPLEKDVTSCLETGSPSKPVHTVTISDMAAPFERFQMGVQCLNILLKYKNGRILELLPNPYKVSALRRQLTQPGRIESVGSRLVPQFLQSLLEQLASQPMEILALYLMDKHCPDLEPERKLAVRALAGCLMAGAVDPKPMQRIVPPEIFNRNFAMNAALAWAVAELANDPLPLGEFRRLGFAEKGRTLFAALQNIGNIVKQDEYYQMAVDTWAGFLQMTDWYVWDTKEARRRG